MDVWSECGIKSTIDGLMKQNISISQFLSILLSLISQYAVGVGDVVRMTGITGGANSHLTPKLMRNFTSPRSPARALADPKFYVPHFSGSSLCRRQFSTIVIANMEKLARLAMRRLRHVASLDDVETDRTALFAMTAEENDGKLLFVASLVDVFAPPGRRKVHDYAPGKWNTHCTGKLKEKGLTVT